MGKKASYRSDNAGLSGLLERIGELSTELEKVGLTNYESRSYLAAVFLGGGKAEEIAEISLVPRTSAYKALESLSERGFVEKSKDRPMRFEPADPISLFGRLRGDLEGTFEEIAKIQESQASRGIPQMIYTLNEKDRVLRKIGEMIDRAVHRFILSSPNISIIRRYHSRSFERGVDRGVEIFVIAPPFVRIPRCTKAVRRRSLIATDVVMDGEEALIASPDLAACGFTDNVLLAGHLEGFLEIVMSENWERAEE